jgi:peptidyl-tRNA hydrolase, PTH1 family
VRIVVGLGNPGRQYEGTRHNIGWMVVDRLADRAGVGGRGKERDSSSVLRVRLHGEDLLLVKPLTFMNDSGLAVRKILARERAPLDDVLVVVDDFALPFGRLRLREQGSPGTHNGLRSIAGELGSHRFPRLRVGIGEPERGAVGHVLTRFSPEERALLDRVLDAAASAVEDWSREGVSRAATRWNAWEVGDDLAPGREGADVPAAILGGPSEPEERAADGSPIRRTERGWRKLLR